MARYWTDYERLAPQWNAFVTSIYLNHLLEQDVSEMVETLDAVFA